MVHFPGLVDAGMSSLCVQDLSSCYTDSPKAESIDQTKASDIVGHKCHGSSVESCPQNQIDNNYYLLASESKKHTFRATSELF